MDEFIVDLHCHSTLRAYYTTEEFYSRNIWSRSRNIPIDSAVGRWARIHTKSILKESQANFYEASRAGVGVLFDSLYPVEKGFFNFRRVPSFFVGKKTEDLVLRTVTGIDEQKLKYLRNHSDYFSELTEQYEFLASNQGYSPNRKHEYALVKSFSELEKLKKSDPNGIAVIVTIEGGHSLGTGGTKDLAQSTAQLKKKTKTNIEKMKEWDYPPFFITLAHHFWNQLCGHTRSLKPPVYSVYNQTIGINIGITDLGWSVIENLLSEGNGKRILLDVKHMSIKSRREYYRFIQRNNRINSSNKIPIICSHTGISGISTFNKALKQKDNVAKMKGEYFHNWNINLCDEEIKIIAESGGLIGIILDKSVLGSIPTVNKILFENEGNKLKEGFLELIWRNIFHIISVLKTPESWNLITVGSDYDGMINYVDSYPTMGYLCDLKLDMLLFLKQKNFQKRLWFDMEPEEIVNRIFHLNALNFLQKHFN